MDATYHQITISTRQIDVIRVHVVAEIAAICRRLALGCVSSGGCACKERHP